MSNNHSTSSSHITHNTNHGCTQCNIVCFFTPEVPRISVVVLITCTNIFIHGGHLGAPRAVPPRVRSARIRYATTALARLTGTAWYSCGIFQGQGTHTYTHTDLEIVETCAGDACAQHGLNRGTQCLVNDSLAHHGLVRLFSPREGGEYV